MARRKPRSCTTIKPIEGHSSPPRSIIPGQDATRPRHIPREHGLRSCIPNASEHHRKGLSSCLPTPRHMSRPSMALRTGNPLRKSLHAGIAGYEVPLCRTNRPEMAPDTCCYALVAGIARHAPLAGRAWEGVSSATSDSRNSPTCTRPASNI